MDIAIFSNIAVGSFNYTVESLLISEVAVVKQCQWGHVRQRLNNAHGN